MTVEVVLETYSIHLDPPGIFRTKNYDENAKGKTIHDSLIKYKQNDRTSDETIKPMITNIFRTYQFLLSNSHPNLITNVSLFSSLFVAVLVSRSYIAIYRYNQVLYCA